MQAITTSMYALGVPANALLAVKGVVVIVVIVLLSGQVRDNVAAARRPAAEGGPDVTAISARLARNRRFAPLAATILLFCLAYAYGAFAYDGDAGSAGLPQPVPRLRRSC